MNRNPDDLFGPVTDAERRAWQLKAHAALATVLSRAAVAELAPVTWTVTDLGGLYGRINEYGRVLTNRKAREQFARWAEFLDLRETSRSAADGAASLRAVGALSAHGGDVVVVLSALLPDRDDSAGPDSVTEEC